MERDAAVAAVCGWYAAQARDLPWRDDDVTPWGVLVSEVMLQQTPVARVLPVWRAWLGRWPTPAALAAEEPGEAVRAWGRLGYPRRAQRLHAAASAIVERHAGLVPSDIVALRALPGVGDYTAAAVATFAYGGRHVVLDTNVRRVLARLEHGTEFPGASVTVGERVAAEAWLPSDSADAARWAVASMELGALVCTAAAPACGRCPVADACAWLAAGRPPWSGPPRRGQAWAGTDRQCRGRLLAVLREATGPLQPDAVRAAWTVDAVQADRALASLLSDGLVRELPDGRLAL